MDTSYPDDTESVNATSRLYNAAPCEVSRDPRVSDGAARLMNEIVGLARRTGVCTAGDTFLAAVTCKQPRSIPRLLDELAALGYIMPSRAKNGKREIHVPSRFLGGKDISQSRKVAQLKYVELRNSAQSDDEQLRNSAQSSNLESRKFARHKTQESYTNSESKNKTPETQESYVRKFALNPEQQATATSVAKELNDIESLANYEGMYLDALERDRIDV